MRKTLLGSSTRGWGLLIACASLVICSHGLRGQQQEQKTAGPTESGYLLPNGWHITPAGRHVATTDLLLNIHPLSDSKRALVTCNGFNEHQLALVDLDTAMITEKQSSVQSWFGLAVDNTAKKLWWSGGGFGQLHTFTLSEDGLQRTSSPEPNATEMTQAEVSALREKLRADNAFRSGVLYDDETQTLYSLLINAGKLLTYGNEGMAEPSTIDVGGRPYDIAKGTNGLLYISDWAGRRIVIVDPKQGRVVGSITVGEHPNQIVVDRHHNRLFVACASSNGVWAVDLSRGVVTEVISTSLFPGAPEGSTPDAVAISPDGSRLFVANADNNCIAVVDVEEPNKSSVLGFIPTGWYPTAVAVTPDGQKLLVGVGKGNQSGANPIPKVPPKEEELTETERAVLKEQPFPYIGTIISGALSIVDMPTEEELKNYTAQVYRNCPYSNDLLKSVPKVGNSVIPAKVGDPCAIKYVIYVIKENRTYDQVFGDMAQGENAKGNGDPSLCMFPRDVTPNHHKLAEEFVLLDNFYCNGQVSRDGHPWSTMAYNTDYIARDWHLTYSRRLGVDDDDSLNLSSAPSGYIWDACLRAGISYRCYKEMCRQVTNDKGERRMEGRVPGLVGHVSPKFGLRTGDDDGRLRDMDQINHFIEEYQQFVNDGTMPQFVVMSLGEDHTDGTRPGSYTPSACVGSNDQALGKLVETVSNGPLWKETAIFVIEDDAQNGPDHVDAHRTVALAISPYVRRGMVDSTQYSTVSMIRTMELILGLQPLSQYDASATPMFACFGDKPDLTPYTCEAPRIDLMAKNDEKSYAADRSLKMDFSEYDLIDDFEMNEILWRAVMGEDAPLPPAVRRAIAFRSSQGLEP